MDPATISAFAAAAAAVFAGAVAGVQLYVGNRQSEAAMKAAEASTKAAEAAVKSAGTAGLHRVAGFRQAWIDKVIDTLCEYHSIIMTTRGPPTPEIARAREALRTKLEILLNPDEVETVALLDELDRVENQARTWSGSLPDDARMIAIARRLLKAEWIRIKTELN
jgi:hypothetical protein